MTGLGWIGSLVIGAGIGWMVVSIDTNKLRDSVLGMVGAILLNGLVFVAVGSVACGWVGQFVLAAIGAGLLIASDRILRLWI